MLFTVIYNINRMAQRIRERQCGINNMDGRRALRRLVIVNVAHKRMFFTNIHHQPT